MKKAKPKRDHSAKQALGLKLVEAQLVAAMRRARQLGVELVRGRYVDWFPDGRPRSCCAMGALALAQGLTPKQPWGPAAILPVRQLSAITQGFDGVRMSSGPRDYFALGRKLWEMVKNNEI